MICAPFTRPKLIYSALLICLFNSMSFGQELPEYIPTEGLMGWYPFNGNANDESGNENNAVPTNVETTIDRFGALDSAFYFDYSQYGNGSLGDMVWIPHSDEFNVPELTVSIWFRQTDLSYPGNPGHQAIVKRVETGYANPPGEFWSLIVNDSGVLAAFIHNNTSISVATNEQAIQQELWYHAVLTYDDETLDLYLNGELVGSQAGSNWMRTEGISGISIGVSNQANGYWRPFKGDIDDLAIWERALSPCEITMLYMSQGTSELAVDAGSDISVCAGDSIILEATGTGDNYTWSNNFVSDVPFAPDSSETLYLDAIVGNCSFTDSLYIEVLSPSASIDSHVVCDSLTWIDGVTYTQTTNEPTVTVENSVGCDSIITLNLVVNQTTFNTIDTTGTNSIVFNEETYTESGEYIVLLENMAGCDSVITLNIDLDYVSVEEADNTSVWRVYPNPARNFLTISPPEETSNYNVQIFNSVGQIIWRSRIDGTAQILSQDWPRGVYVIEFYEGENYQRIPILVE